jgi:hypothetical protein
MEFREEDITKESVAEMIRLYAEADGLTEEEERQIVGMEFMARMEKCQASGEGHENHVRYQKKVLSFLD